MIFDFRFTRFAVAFVALIGIPAAVFADDPPKAKTLPEAKKSTAFDPVEITIHPKTAPVPALKYRLFPAEPDRTPGDAAPIYIRLGVGMQGTETIHKRVGELASLPVKDLPIDEARKLVEQLRFRLEQLSFGARRKTCDWNYTLSEQREDAITILLPDVQEMRNWTRVLQVKIGLEIAEKKYDDAIRDIETGIAFSRHVGEGPFLINMLVGTAQANVMLAKIEELIAEPDAPNLYWALTALPQPLVGVRMALENEQRLGEWMIPEITNLDLPRTDGEWSAVLGRLHARLMKLRKDLVSQEQKATGQLGEDRTLAEFRNENLADAKAFYQSRQLKTDGVSDDEMLVRSIAGRYREFRDDCFKTVNFPYPSFVRFNTSENEQQQAKEKPLMRILAAFTPSAAAAASKLAEARTDRRVAALRIIEALRMHAAAKAGPLPTSLDEITLVPIPLDPVTGKPFSYKKNGEVATLSAPPPATGQPGLTYHITLKK